MKIFKNKVLYISFLLNSIFLFNTQANVPNNCMQVQCESPRNKLVKILDEQSNFFAQTNGCLNLSISSESDDQLLLKLNYEGENKFGRWYKIADFVSLVNKIFQFSLVNKLVEQKNGFFEWKFSQDFNIEKMKKCIQVIAAICSATNVTSGVALQHLEDSVLDQLNLNETEKIKAAQMIVELSHGLNGRVHWLLPQALNILQKYPCLQNSWAKIIDIARSLMMYASEYSKKTQLFIYSLMHTPGFSPLPPIGLGINYYKINKDNFDEQVEEGERIKLQNWYLVIIFSYLYEMNSYLSEQHRTCINYLINRFIKQEQGCDIKAFQEVFKKEIGFNFAKLLIKGWYQSENSYAQETVLLLFKELIERQCLVGSDINYAVVLAWEKTKSPFYYVRNSATELLEYLFKKSNTFEIIYATQNAIFESIINLDANVKMAGFELLKRLNEIDQKYYDDFLEFLKIKLKKCNRVDQQNAIKAFELLINQPNKDWFFKAIVTLRKLVLNDLDINEGLLKNFEILFNQNLGFKVAICMLSCWVQRGDSMNCVLELKLIDSLLQFDVVRLGIDGDVFNVFFSITCCAANCPKIDTEVKNLCKNIFDNLIKTRFKQDVDYYLQETGLSGMNALEISQHTEEYNKNREEIWERLKVKNRQLEALDFAGIDRFCVPLDSYSLCGGSF